MTERDLDQPHMIWTGPLPSHLTRGDEPAAQETFEGDGVGSEAEARPSPLPLIVTFVAALAVGIAIGAVVPPLLHPSHPRAVTAPQPAPKPDFTSLPGPPAVPAPSDAAAATVHIVPARPAPLPTPIPSLRPEHRAIHASAPHDSRQAHKPEASARHAGACRLGDSQADYQVCAFPQVAEADRDLKRAYRQAQSAGVPAEALKADEAAWQPDREIAAHRSATQLAMAYRAHIAKVEALAVEAPH